MARLEIKKNEHEETGWSLVLDGERVEPRYLEDKSEPEYYIVRFNDSIFQLSCTNDETCRTLSKVRLVDISPELSIVQLNSDNIRGFIQYSFEYHNTKSLYHNAEYIDKTEPEIYIVLNMRINKWKNPWSAEEFSFQFLKLFRSSTSYPAATDLSAGLPGSGIRIGVPFTDKEVTIEKEVQKILPTIDKTVEETRQILQARLDENSLLNYFNFHPTFQGACEEYLWSFIQFLKDVGVEATAKLTQDQEDPSKVLFSVTPKRGKAILGKVKQALDLYISLLGSTEFEFDSNASFQSDRLERRIQMAQLELKAAHSEARSQLAAIQAHETTIEAQRATIQAHQITLATQAGALSEMSLMNLLLNSRVDQLEKEKAQKAKDEREFFGGIVRLGNWNTKGFIINIPRLLDKVKAIMIEDDNTTDASVVARELPPAPDSRSLPLHDEIRD